MKLNERQELFKNKCINALKKHGNTLGIAPTGCGKTVILSSIINDLKIRTCVLSHRVELLIQNQNTFYQYNSNVYTSKVIGMEKDFSGNVIFASTQTLMKNSTLEKLPKISFLVIDEAHHSASFGYQKIANHVKAQNPNVKILGLTATPNRSDGKNLRETFNNVADQIFIEELISSGHLVKPRTFTIDLGVQEELKNVSQFSGDFNMEEVEKILNIRPLNKSLVENWKRLAFTRQTVVFASTVKHADTIRCEFENQGIVAKNISGNMPPKERKQIIELYEKKEIQVLTNVFVLTEGWNSPETSCVILARPSSHKSAMIQMIGRGLRTYPGKTDCLVLDFGISTILHGNLEQEATNVFKESPKGETPTKVCPKCYGLVPINLKICPFCEANFKTEENKKETKELNVILKEFSLFEKEISKSNFKFEKFEQKDKSPIYVANGFNAFVSIFTEKNTGNYKVIGSTKTSVVKLLFKGNSIECVKKAVEWMSKNETKKGVTKSKHWLKEPATERQIEILKKSNLFEENIKKYRAACLIVVLFNKSQIKTIIEKN